MFGVSWGSQDGPKTLRTNLMLNQQHQNKQGRTPDSILKGGRGSSKVSCSMYVFLSMTIHVSMWPATAIGCKQASRVRHLRPVSRIPWNSFISSSVLDAQSIPPF